VTDRPWKPTRDDVAAAEGATVPDVAAPRLDVLFCGINPGLYSGAVGHHFARPGNRFWKALHGSGFTPILLGPFDEHELLPLALGITNLVERATAGATDLDPAELRAGADRLRRKVRRLEPRFLAVLGVGAFRTAFAEPDAVVGPQELRLGAARVWVLPNPSGLNAHYQLPGLTAEFERLRTAVRRRRRPR
jgi:TDG/mug DNA glycosylase family protein